MISRRNAEKGTARNAENVAAMKAEKAPPRNVEKSASRNSEKESLSLLNGAALELQEMENSTCGPDTSATAENSRGPRREAHQVYQPMLQQESPQASSNRTQDEYPRLDLVCALGQSQHPA